MANINLTAKKRVRSGYRPENQIVSWMDLIPDSLAVKNNGKVFIMPKGNDTFQHMTNKGVTHFTNYDLVAATPQEYNQMAVVDGRKYDEAVKTRSQFGLNGSDDPNAAVWQRVAGTPDEYPHNEFPFIWNKTLFQTDDNAIAPMTPEQGTIAGNNISTSASTVIFESLENVHAASAHWPFRRTYYEAFIPRMIAEWGAKGIQWYVADNYFSSAGKTLYYMGGAAIAKAYASKPVSQWDDPTGIIRGNLKLTNTGCFGIYNGALDLNKFVAYDIVYNGFLHDKAGKFLFVFMQGFLEWKPNNHISVENADGSTLYFHSKLPHTPTQSVAYVFLALIHTTGYIPFSMAGKGNRPWKLLAKYHKNGSMYYQAGSNTPSNVDNFSGWINEGDGNRESFPSNGVADFIGFGKSLYDETFGSFVGGTTKYLRFRVDGGSWIEPSNVDANDICDASYQRRGYVYSKLNTAGTKLAWYYLNSFADINLHTVEFQHMNYMQHTFTVEVHSSAIHAGVIDLNTLNNI